MLSSGWLNHPMWTNISPAHIFSVQATFSVARRQYYLPTLDLQLDQDIRQQLRGQL